MECESKRCLVLEGMLVRCILHADSEPEDESLAMGNLIHKTFEAVTNTKLSDEQAVKFFLDELEKHDLSPEISQKIREKGKITCLQNTLYAVM